MQCDKYLMLNVNYKLEDTIKFTCYKQSPSGLGKFLFFKTYTMKYNICTYADYRNI